MASISSCTARLLFSTTNKPLLNTCSTSSSLKLSSRFLGTRVVKLRIRLGPSNGSRTTCWFKFGKNGVDAENAGIYGSQSRDDFDRDDVEQYFNYMGMLAVEGTYDKMEALLNQNIHPVDILLMLAALKVTSLRSKSFSGPVLTTQSRTLTEEPLLTEPAQKRSGT